MSKQAKNHLKPDKLCLPHNLVAKNAFKFNKAHVFSDKRIYNRKAKSKGQEPFAISLVHKLIAKGSLVSIELKSNFTLFKSFVPTILSLTTFRQGCTFNA